MSSAMDDEAEVNIPIRKCLELDYFASPNLDSIKRSRFALFAPRESEGTISNHLRSPTMPPPLCLASMPLFYHDEVEQEESQEEADEGKMSNLFKTPTKEATRQSTCNTI
jgi:hypothetical protein